MNIAAFDIEWHHVKNGHRDSAGELPQTDKAAIRNSDGDAILAQMPNWVTAHPGLRGSPSARRGINPHTGFIGWAGPFGASTSSQ